MLSDDDLKKHKYSNMFRCLIALQYLREFLIVFCEDIVKTYHASLLKTLPKIKDSCKHCTLEKLLPFHLHEKKACPSQSKRKCFCSKKAGRQICPNAGFCSKFFDLIVLEHRFRDPLWKNTDPRKWKDCPWSVAVCFINTQGYHDKETAYDTDCRGLLSIIINNLKFEAELQGIPINGENDIFKKVRDFANLVHHSHNCEITDENTQSCMKLVKTILQIKSSTVTDVLQKFQSDPILTSSLVNLLPSDTESKEESETDTRLACSTNDIRKGEADVCSGCILKNGRRTNNEIDIGLHERLSPKNGERTEYRPTEEIQYFPGITNEKPKHPDFAIRRARLSSFSQWTKGHVMKPEDLAEAGFYFSGVRDFVRCFFCGGGLKNWEYGDSPWIEHARRFSTCAYIKQCKGEHFITLCQISNMTFPTQINVQLRDLDSGQTNIVEDQCITDLNSIAAKRVLDMGYMQTQVEYAIRDIRQRLGPVEELKAQNILEYLLDNSYTRSNASASTPGQHSNTTRNRSQSSSPNSRQSDQSNVAIDERKSLNEENRQELKEQIMCKICFDKDANIVLLPCGHLASCVECAHALRKCAICRTVIQGTVRIYQA